MFPELPPLQSSIKLAPRDWLLIFSDGIPEAIDENGREFGEEAILKVVRHLRAVTAADACARIIDEVRDHCSGRHQADDISLIAIKVLKN